MTALPKDGRRPQRERDIDVLVVGSGYGGSMAAEPLVAAGHRVVMVERGPWVPRGLGAWNPEGTLELNGFYTDEYESVDGGPVRAVHCVGGPSVFAGAVAMRYRQDDFDRRDERGAALWPLAYADVEPYYDRCEELLQVAGSAGLDPTEPPRRGPYPQAPPPLSPISERIADAGRRLGHEPFPLPLAINYGGDQERTACVRCASCDTFACAIAAKNDMAATLVPRLLHRGMELRTELTVLRVLVERGRAVGIECRDGKGRLERLYAPRVIVAAGALATPRLLLASRVSRHNPAGHLVGRYLMRHCNAVVMGVFPRRLPAVQRFHKQVGLGDACSDADADGTRIVGSLQQLGSPPRGLLADAVPRALRRLVEPVADRLTGLLAIAEDEPQSENRVALHPDGRRGGAIHHAYSAADLAARDRLVAQARAVLREAGAFATYRHDVPTFSHAVGTVRMGPDPRTSLLDRDGRFRGVEGLYVADGSALPTSAGVNPSLTISANALRIGTAIARTSDVPARSASR